MPVREIRPDLATLGVLGYQSRVGLLRPKTAERLHRQYLEVVKLELGGLTDAGPSRTGSWPNYSGTSFTEITPIERPTEPADSSLRYQSGRPRHRNRGRSHDVSVDRAVIMRAELGRSSEKLMREAEQLELAIETLKTDQA